MPVFTPSILTTANIRLWKRNKMTAVENGFTEKERMANTNHRPMWQWSPSGENHRESSPECLSLGPWKALLWPLSFVVPGSALWTSLPFYFMTSSEVGTGAMPFLGVSQLLYPNSSLHRFQSPGIILGTGESFADQVCGFLGHIISSET